MFLSRSIRLKTVFHGLCISVTLRYSHVYLLFIYTARLDTCALRDASLGYNLLLYMLTQLKCFSVQDIKVCEPPKPLPTLQGGLPNDPAIIQVSDTLSRRDFWKLILPNP